MVWDVKSLLKYSIVGNGQGKRQMVRKRIYWEELTSTSVLCDLSRSHWPQRSMMVSNICTYYNGWVNFIQRDPLLIIQHCSPPTPHYVLNENLGAGSEGREGRFSLRCKCGHFSFLPWCSLSGSKHLPVRWCHSHNEAGMTGARGVCVCVCVCKRQRARERGHLSMLQAKLGDTVLI